MLRYVFVSNWTPALESADPPSVFKGCGTVSGLSLLGFETKVRGVGVVAAWRTGCKRMVGENFLDIQTDPVRIRMVSPNNLECRRESFRTLGQLRTDSALNLS